MDRRRKVELLKRLGGNMRMEPVRFARSRRSWGCIGGWCGKRWRGPFRRSANGRCGTGPVGPAMEFIDEILRRDETAPRKQRQYMRIALVTIRQERTGASGGNDGAPLRAGAQARARVDSARDVRAAGRPTGAAKGRADWYEAARAEIGGERQSVHHFAMRSMASGGTFNVAHHHDTQ